MRLFLLSLALLCAYVTANTALPSNWKPLALGVCTVAPIPGMETARPPYTGDNANPLIAEAVQSNSEGRTCNLNSAVDVMPQLYKDKYLLAASQDLYNGKLVSDAFSDDCSHVDVSRTGALEGDMCGAACGVCFLVNGPSGSAVWIVNEIADVNAVGQNGEGLNFHLDNDHRSDVRTTGGVHKDIQYKRVPCPVEGSVYIKSAGNYGAVAMYFTIINHRTEIRSVETRGGAGGDQEWVPLVRDWTNRWHWENYGCANCIEWQRSYGGITRGSTNDDFELRVTDVTGNSIICTGLTRDALPQNALVECVDGSGVGQQLPEVSFDLTACDGSEPANKDYYPTTGVTPEPPTDAVTPEPPTDAVTTEPPTDAVTTEPPTDAVTTEPPTDAPITGPGVIPAESFVGRVDLSPGNDGGQTCGNSQSAQDGNLVDMELARDTANPGGCNVGWVRSGESLTYDVTFSGTTSYTIDARVAGKNGNKEMDIFVDDETTARATISFAATGGWQRYTTASADLGTVTGGDHQIRVEFKTSSINLHFLDIYQRGQSRGSSTSSAVTVILSYMTLFMCLIIQIINLA